MERKNSNYIWLCVLCMVCLLALPVGAVYQAAQPTNVLDGILPNEQYRQGGTTTATDPADGMPWESDTPRFGEDPNTQDRAADGSAGGNSDTRAPSPEEMEGVSPWIAVLVTSLAATAVVIAVLYLVPSRKRKK